MLATTIDLALVQTPLHLRDLFGQYPRPLRQRVTPRSIPRMRVLKAVAAPALQDLAHPEDDGAVAHMKHLPRRSGLEGTLCSGEGSLWRVLER